MMLNVGGHEGLIAHRLEGELFLALRCSDIVVGIPQAEAHMDPCMTLRGVFELFNGTPGVGQRDNDGARVQMWSVIVRAFESAWVNGDVYRSSGVLSSCSSQKL